MKRKDSNNCTAIKQVDNTTNPMLCFVFASRTSAGRKQREEVDQFFSSDAIGSELLKAASTYIRIRAHRKRIVKRLKKVRLHQKSLVPVEETIAEVESMDVTVHQLTMFAESEELAPNGSKSEDAFAASNCEDALPFDVLQYR